MPRERLRSGLDSQVGPALAGREWRSRFRGRIDNQRVTTVRVRHSRTYLASVGKTAAYTIIPFLPPGLDTVGSQVTDLNEVGQAVGSADIFIGLGGARAVHLNVGSGVYTELTDGSVARGVNNLNQTVGFVDLPSESGSLLKTMALFWAAPTADPVELQPLPGDVYSYAYAHQ